MSPWKLFCSQFSRLGSIWYADVIYEAIDSVWRPFRGARLSMPVSIALGRFPKASLVTPVICWPLIVAQPNMLVTREGIRSAQGRVTRSLTHERQTRAEPERSIQNAELSYWAHDFPLGLSLL